MLLPLVVALGGGLVYWLSPAAKPSELGRILFFVGALWLVYLLATHRVQVTF